MAESTQVHAHDIIEPETTGPEVVRVVPKGTYLQSSAISSSSNTNVQGIATQTGRTERNSHGAVEMVSTEAQEDEQPPAGLLANFRLKRRSFGQYIKTREFWIVLAFGQVLSLLLTGQNTFSELLSINRVSIPAFQSLFNYVILNLVFTSYTLYSYGFKKWAKVVLKDGWKYFIWAFIDVEGNYFFVLAYRYTNILSATLIDFWAIAVVVLVSLIFLKVRYHLFQYLGILVCIGGLGIVLGSDYIHGNTDAYAPRDAVKGDLFALLGATFYGLSNVAQEVFASKKPVYEVLGQLGFWATIINGVQAGIFEHNAFQNSHFNGAAGGYLAGFTVLLAAFYMTVPVFLRLGSAAVFNISLLTSDFWSVIVGVQVFHLTIHWMYPIAFVCIVLGLLVYFLTEGVLGDSQKPWLGPEQEKGVNGIGTARRKIERQAVIVTEAGPQPAEAVSTAEKDNGTVSSSAMV